MSDVLQKAFDPESFRRKGHAMIDQLADHLSKMQSTNIPTKIYDQTDPESLYEFWKEDYASPKGNWYMKALEQMIHLHHPHYVGHQKAPPVPDAVLGELFGAFTDLGMGIYEQGTTGVVLERLISEIIAAKIGYDPNSSSGFLTSGGTLGNLTALLCARAVKIKTDVWQHGYQGKQFAFMVSEEAHYSVDRAIRVMGMGAAGLIKIPVDKHYRMDTEQLSAALKKARSENIEVIGVIANACTTSVGSHDDLEAIGTFCEANQLWMHVDAAHGGALLFSKKYRKYLNGIERADSVIFDFHKMLLTPSLVTAVLFKNGQHSYQTFAQRAAYLWDNQESGEWYNLAKRTFELTKTTMSFRVYALLRNGGEQLFNTYLERQYDLSRSFARIIDQLEHFEMPVAAPESNIVCFRYRPPGMSAEEVDKINIRIRETIVAEGQFFLVQTRLKGHLYLRVTLINPFTTQKHLRTLLDKIQALL
jgi:L-2,4-diaminobutyrate decarboxylase